MTQRRITLDLNPDPKETEFIFSNLYVYKNQNKLKKKNPFFLVTPKRIVRASSKLCSEITRYSSIDHNVASTGLTKNIEALVCSFLLDEPR